jgi:initiation factor 1A
MPRNMTGGKGAKKRKNNPPEEKDPATAPFKDEEQDYGYIIDEMGDRRFQIRIITPQYVIDQMVSENKQDISSEPQIILGRVRGKLNRNKSGKATSVKKGSYVLLSRRDFQTDMADILYNYRADEIEWLKKKKQLPYALVDPNNKNIGSKLIFKKRESDNKKDKKLLNSQNNYLDDSMIPSSDDDSEEDVDTNTNQKYDHFGNLITDTNSEKQNEEDDSEEDEDETDSETNSDEDETDSETNSEEDESEEDETNSETNSEEEDESKEAKSKEAKS